MNRSSVLASLNYGIPTKTRWIPCIGELGCANVGTSNMDCNCNVALGSGGRALETSVVPGGSGSAFGCQARVGPSYFASRSMDLFVEGNYFWNTGVEPGSGSAFDSFNSFWH